MMLRWILLLLLAACVPMSPELERKVEEQQYEQQEREIAFALDRQRCEDDYGGHMLIDRDFTTRRIYEIREVPGPKDRWYCVEGRY